MHDGGDPVTLRWFPTKTAAEDFPVKLSSWKRVWVERREAPPPVERGALPWHIERNSAGFIYVLDANKSRLMSLLGSTADRERVVRILRSVGFLVGEDVVDDRR